MPRLIGSLTAAIALIVSTAIHAQVLYDGPAGGTPESQPWLTYQSSTFSNHHAASGGATVLDTTSTSGIMAGWHNYSFLLSGRKNAAFPVLERSSGFTVAIDLRVISESHVSNDRAGFSLIALGNDNKGIELSFWQDEIWAQSGPNHLNPAEALFTHAEGVAHTTTGNLQRYEVSILGDAYSLTANGSPILSGVVRDYSSWPGTPNVYALPSFLFFGDNTSSAAGAVEISFIAIPEPATAGSLLLLAISTLVLGRRRS